MTSKIIGKPFKCTPEKSAMVHRKRVCKPHRQLYAVCECDCGTIYVSTISKVKDSKRTYRPKSSHCQNCTGRNGKESRTQDWEFRLRERFIRHQHWYQDRIGSQRCDHCHKRRAFNVISTYDQKEGGVYLCRECNAVYHLRPQIVQTQTHSVRFLNGTRHDGQEDPSFENMIRMIEDQ